MSMESGQKINDFLNEVFTIDEEKGEIVVSLRTLILNVYPKAEEEIKYGGLVFIIDKRLFCGIFLRKNHVSVEFDNGAKISDPANLLEGSGKQRRHLKITKFDDIEDKKVKFYLKQAFNS